MQNGGPGVAQHSIFIGYRREDTADACSRIYERLEPVFGKPALFMDIDKIPYGDDFRALVKSIVPKCSVFLAMIGPRWTQARDERTGARRLDDPEDLVRVEIEIAFATPGVQVIPVLVNGAPMPEAAELPPSLQRLRGLNAAKVRREDFNDDMRRLIEALRERLGSGATVAVAERVAAPASGSAGAWAIIAGSLDPADYADFIAHFPGATELIQASRHKRRLEAWAQVDKSDPDAVATFLREASFPALEQLAKETMQRAADAKQRAFEQALAERRKAEEAARKAEEERGLKPRRAAEAARAGRPVAERAFPIELPGVSGWPTPQMIVIPRGKFLMGAPANEEGSRDDERPQHEVRIDYAFALGQHTVTVDAFKAFVAETNHDTGKSAFVWTGNEWKNTPGKGWRDPGFAQTGAHPVCCVNWEDAQAYLAWLNDKAGLTDRPDAYRLPSEAEWEYACRAGTTTPFSFGATISTAQANYDGNYTYGPGKKGEWRQKTTPVGSFPANAFGLHDMHGNVWEWCQDCWNANYNGAPSDGSAWTTGDCTSRVLRGGSWNDSPQVLRSAYRGWGSPTNRDLNRGFRLARTL
jgi:formylglycine-generating enzyme required for sulfatase activity